MICKIIQLLKKMIARIFIITIEIFAATYQLNSDANGAGIKIMFSCMIELTPSKLHHSSEMLAVANVHPSKKSLLIHFSNISRKKYP